MSGYPTRAVARQSTAVEVDTSSTEVVKANPNRVELTLVNDGQTVVYLALQTDLHSNPTAEANKGIRLNPGGGSYTTTSFTGAIYGIADTSASVVTVAEI